MTDVQRLNMLQEGSFQAFPVDFSRITPKLITAAFDEGGPDFTNLVVAILTADRKGKINFNLPEEARQKLDQITAIGKGYYRWADLIDEREAMG